MKKSLLTVALTLTCLLGFDISARALDAGGVVVKVPFEFVAGGKTMLPGVYSVGRVTPDIDQSLMIRSDGNNVLVIPAIFDGTPAEHAKLSFQHVGDKYFLSNVETPAGVYTIGIPRAMTKVAQMTDHGSFSSSGDN